MPRKPAGSTIQELPLCDAEGRTIDIVEVPRKHVNMALSCIPEQYEASDVPIIKQRIMVMCALSECARDDTEEREKLLRNLKDIHRELGVDEHGQAVRDRWENLNDDAQQWWEDNLLRMVHLCPGCGDILQLESLLWAWLVMTHPEIAEQVPEQEVRAKEFPFLKRSQRALITWSEPLMARCVWLNEQYRVPWEDLLAMAAEILDLGEMALEPRLDHAQMSHYLKQLQEVDWEKELGPLIEETV